ncbi:unnamed protein product [Ambrosiozyma monospora]|uniref:Unnamed protein product n=1 Tax=Ambrosiozyma monospora TaxID=43982 RepID=A0ACB5T4G5_AMBMO|nr:unnamed protein product [Ambrosiozyma monospora]
MCFDTDEQLNTHLTIPKNKRDLFYLPQRSYLTYGSLKEQIIYPDSIDDYNAKIVAAKCQSSTSESSNVVKDDEYLIGLLKIVELDHLVDQYSSNADAEDATDSEVDSTLISDTTNDQLKLNNGKHGNCTPSQLDSIVAKWPDVLTTGEQQRLAMARLYYHQPKFAVLDECTSLISPIDLELKCYQVATEMFGITVLSVCHRTSLWRFHKYVLKFKRVEEGDDVNDGAATTLFTKFDPELRLQRHDELIEIDGALKKGQMLAKRLEMLKAKNLSRLATRSPPKMFIEDDEDEDDDF